MALLFVGKTRFELATPCTPYKCATGLRHFPNGVAKLIKNLPIANLSKGVTTTFYLQNIYLCLIPHI